MDETPDRGCGSNMEVTTWSLTVILKLLRWSRDLGVGGVDGGARLFLRIQDCQLCTGYCVTTQEHAKYPGLISVSLLGVSVLAARNPGCWMLAYAIRKRLVAFSVNPFTALISCRLTGSTVAAPGECWALLSEGLEKVADWKISLFRALVRFSVTLGSFLHCSAKPLFTSGLKATDVWVLQFI